MQSELKLESCPFCGEAESLYVMHYEGTIKRPAYLVRCDNCGASGPTTDEGTHVEDWNRRAGSDAVHPKGTIGDEGGSSCCPLTMTRDAKPAPVDESVERERFEAWYTERYTSYLPMHNGDYSNLDTRLAWKSWQAALATAGGDVCAAGEVLYGAMTLDEIRQSPRNAGVEEVEAMADALLFKPVSSPCWPRDGRNIDEVIVDLVAANKRIYELEQQLAGGDEPIRWESTTPAYTRYITDSRYRTLKPEFQKWYRPICPDSSRLAEAVRDLIDNGNTFVVYRHGEQFVCDVVEYEALRQALAQYENKEV